MQPSLALYRRYRPETFAELIGQDHVTEPLRAALANNRVNHAYLFSGPRGCGKTTSARILARALNCEQAPIADPCGQCQSCVDLGRDGAGSVDVIEMDAASHGGVDDARDLRERAFFAPVMEQPWAAQSVTALEEMAARIDRAYGPACDDFAVLDVARGLGALDEIAAFAAASAPTA